MKAEDFLKKTEHTKPNSPRESYYSQDDLLSFANRYGTQLLQEAEKRIKKLEKNAIREEINRQSLESYIVRLEAELSNDR